MINPALRRNNHPRFKSESTLNPGFRWLLTVSSKGSSLYLCQPWEVDESIRTLFMLFQSCRSIPGACPDCSIGLPGNEWWHHDTTCGKTLTVQNHQACFAWSDITDRSTTVTSGLEQVSHTHTHTQRWAHRCWVGRRNFRLSFSHLHLSIRCSGCFRLEQRKPVSNDLVGGWLDCQFWLHL